MKNPTRGLRGLFCLALTAAVVLRVHVGAQTDSATAFSARDSDGDGYSDEQEEAWATDADDAGQHPDLDSGLVGWWRFDEGSGVSVADASGNGRDGELKGAVLPQWSSDASGAALTFDGANFVSVTDSPALTPESGLTLVAWVRLSPNAGGQIVSKWSGIASEGSYSLSLVNGHPALELTLAGVYRPLIGSTAITDSDWHQVVAVFDGRRARLYLDGARIGATDTGGPIDVIKEPLRIGQVSGSVADVGLYARALSDGHVMLLYQVSAGGTATKALALRTQTPMNRLFAVR
jgi:hypothetical protein